MWKWKDLLKLNDANMFVIQTNEKSLHSISIRLNLCVLFFHEVHCSLGSLCDSFIHSFIQRKIFLFLCVNSRMNCFARECNINSQRTNERIAHILIKTTFTRFISNSLKNIIATVRRDKFLTIHSYATEMLKHFCIAKLVEIFISFEMRCYYNFRFWNLVFFSSLHLNQVIVNFCDIGSPVSYTTNS